MKDQRFMHHWKLEDVPALLSLATHIYVNNFFTIRVETAPMQGVPGEPVFVFYRDTPANDQQSKAECARLYNALWAAVKDTETWTKDGYWVGWGTVYNKVGVPAAQPGDTLELLGVSFNFPPGAPKPPQVRMRDLTTEGYEAIAPMVDHWSTEAQDQFYGNLPEPRFDCRIEVDGVSAGERQVERSGIVIGLFEELSKAEFVSLVVKVGEEVRTYTPSNS